MSEIIQCPSCHRALQIPEVLVGQDVQCPTCGATFMAALKDLHPAPGQQSGSGPPHEGDRPWTSDRGPDIALAGSPMPHRGGVVLAFGILSLVLCGLLGPVAWMMGNADLEAMRKGQKDPSGEGMTQAGRICGIIGTVRLFLELFGGMLLCAGKLLH
jgi:hypothetical protein